MSASSLVALDLISVRDHDCDGHTVEEGDLRNGCILGAGPLHDRKLCEMYVMEPTAPESKGETTHPAAILMRPSSNDQFKQPVPTPAMVMPTTPPTTQCVVDMGKENRVTPRRNVAAPNKAAILPN